MVFIIVASVIIFILLCVLDNYTKRDRYKYIKNFNGPKPLPIIGNVLYIICKREEILNKINYVFDNFKHPLRFWFFRDLFVGTAIPSQVEKILTSTKLSQKHELYRFIESLIGKGLITTSGPRHKMQRKIIQPFFDIKYSKSKIESYQKHIDLCMKRLESVADNKEFDLFEQLHCCFMDMICEDFLGIDINSQKGENLDIINAVNNLFKIVITRIARPWLHPDFIYRLTKFKTIEDENKLIMRNFYYKAIENSRKRIKIENYIEENYDQINVIDKLTHHFDTNPNDFTEDEFLGHLLTLVSAAEDPVTSISSFAAMCLGMYPKYQEIAYQEVLSVFPNGINDMTSLEDLSKLEFLEMCIKETMRLFPIAPYVLRRIQEDFELNEDITYPKGSILMIPFYQIHRIPSEWEKPNDFYPYHFLPEAVKKRHPYAYLPFSTGNRGCIGKLFAHTVLKLFLANLLLNYEFYHSGKVDDLKLHMDISVRPTDGYKIRFTKRVMN